MHCSVPGASQNRAVWRWGGENWARRVAAAAVRAVVAPTELQHCYCKLCRQLSSAACMTWVPVQSGTLQWEETGGLELVRTTGHGQRHLCTQCGSVMTILYENQDGAGSGLL